MFRCVGDQAKRILVTYTHVRGAARIRNVRLERAPQIIPQTQYRYYIVCILFFHGRWGLREGKYSRNGGERWG